MHRADPRRARTGAALVLALVGTASTSMSLSGAAAHAAGGSTAGPARRPIATPARAVPKGSHQLQFVLRPGVRPGEGAGCVEACATLWP